MSEASYAELKRRILQLGYSTIAIEGNIQHPLFDQLHIPGFSGLGAQARCDHQNGRARGHGFQKTSASNVQHLFPSLKEAASIASVCCIDVIIRCRAVIE